MAKTKRTPVDFSELGGFRYLHFGSEWIQGGMRINRPYSLALEYQQYMLALLFFRPEPKDILQLARRRRIGEIHLEVLSRCSHESD